MSKCYVEKNHEGMVIIREYRSWNPTAEEIACAMNAADMEKALDLCGGDFSRIEPLTAKAMSIKATLQLEKRDAQAEKAKENYKRRSQCHHDSIVAEMRELADGKPFIPSTIQLAAVQKGNGYPVRTRQMYTRHIMRAMEEKVVVRAVEVGQSVHVVYADGHMGLQTIGKVKNYYQFTAEGERK